MSIYRYAGNKTGEPVKEELVAAIQLMRNGFKHETLVRHETTPDWWLEMHQSHVLSLISGQIPKLGALTEPEKRSDSIFLSSFYSVQNP